MNETAGYIEHQGIVAAIDDKKVLVNLINTSSCSSCHVKSFCNVSDTDNKTIEISQNAKNMIKKGDHVIVNYEKSMGPKALFLGYVLPFLLVISVLVLTLELTKNEAVAGLSSLAILLPYYLSLYVFRNELKTRFEFKIKTIKP